MAVNIKRFLAKNHAKSTFPPKSGLSLTSTLDFPEIHLLTCVLAVRRMTHTRIDKKDIITCLNLLLIQTSGLIISLLSIML